MRAASAKMACIENSHLHECPPRPRPPDVCAPGFPPGPGSPHVSGSVPVSTLRQTKPSLNILRCHLLISVVQMSVISLSSVVAHMQLSGCPAKAGPQVATHTTQLLPLSHWRPLAQPQTSKCFASQRGGQVKALASVTQTPTQDLANSQKVVLQVSHAP